MRKIVKNKLLKDNRFSKRQKNIDIYMYIYSSVMTKQIHV